ncbi:MAG TPA: response regulator transcription factor [Bacillota bacterium]|nr:response regulator transcription factor [Bacillota bacterium]
MKQTILIVDDEESIVRLLAFNIEKAGYLIDVARDGHQAIKKAKQHAYDLIILDILLPGIDGLSVCTHLREHRIETPILMLTAKGTEHDKVLGLDLGADDYLTKPFSLKELLARMRAIMRRAYREGRVHGKAVHVGDLIIYPDRFEAEKNANILTFTRKEFELLYYLAIHQGQVLSRERLLKDVWDYDFAGDTRIVDVHISRLREKIESDSKHPVYIKTVRGLGYKMEAATP